MLAAMDPKEPSEPGADVVPIQQAQQARERAAADQARERTGSTAAGDGAAEAAASGEGLPAGAALFLKPVMDAIARELAGVVDPEGAARAGGSDEASRAKTAAVVKGLGIGLGQALAEAFGKWAQRIETGEAAGPAAGADEPGDQKPS